MCDLLYKNKNSILRKIIVISGNMMIIIVILIFIMNYKLILLPFIIIFILLSGFFFNHILPNQCIEVNEDRIIVYYNISIFMKFNRRTIYKRNIDHIFIDKQNYNVVIFSKDKEYYLKLNVFNNNNILLFYLKDYLKD